MQYINNKLKEISEKLTEISHLQTIEQKQDTIIIDMLRTIAANTEKVRCSTCNKSH